MTDHNELLERLKDAHANSQQRCLGSDIFNETAEAIRALQEQIEGMYASHSIKCNQHEDDLQALQEQVKQLEEYKTAALFSWESLPEYKKAQAKITELQVVVDKLASNRSMSGDYGSSSIEFNARIEYAKQHATEDK